MRKQNTQGKCVFCDGVGLTKEHVFAEWLRSVLSVDGVRHEQWVTETTTRGKDVIIQPFYRFEQGDSFSRKIRKFCGTCNNGWMSDLQEDAKPVLTPLLTDVPTTLSQADQETLVKWITMTAIVSEYLDIQTIAVTDAERRTFYESEGCALPGWQIYIGRYEGDIWRRRYRHTCLFAVLGHNDAGVPVRKPVGQYLVMMLGHLVIHVFSCPDEVIKYDPSLAYHGHLIQILPPPRVEVIWPPALTFDDPHAEELANNVYELMSDN